jgi:hypothetical protein
MKAVIAETTNEEQMLSLIRTQPNTNESEHEALSFELLEDVMSLSCEESEEIISRARIERIGPIVEYAYHNSKSLDRLGSNLDSEVLKSLADAVDAARHSHFNSSLSFETSTAVEFSRTPQTREEVEDPRWMAFCKRLMGAGIKAGLSKSFSQGLSGTLEEMTSNIIEHSDCASSGLTGYRWVSGEFEYVVADRGIGVLSSLRKHADYSWLEDAGEALEVAVCDGESRYGRNAHRGTGFHYLLYNIASRDSYLRFRSGDHCYSIDGTVQPILKKTYPCSSLDGFLISLIAKPPKEKA